MGERKSILNQSRLLNQRLFILMTIEYWLLSNSFPIPSVHSGSVLLREAPGGTFGWVPQETCCCLQEEWLNEWLKLVFSKKKCNISRVIAQFAIVAFKINGADGQWRGSFCTNVLHGKVFGHILVPNLLCQRLFLPEFYHCCVCNCSNHVWKWNPWGWGGSGWPSNTTFPLIALWMKSIINDNN